MIINVNDEQLHRAVCPPCKWESTWMPAAWTGQEVSNHLRDHHNDG